MFLVNLPKRLIRYLPLLRLNFSTRLTNRASNFPSAISRIFIALGLHYYCAAVGGSEAHIDSAVAPIGKRLYKKSFARPYQIPRQTFELYRLEHSEIVISHFF